MKLNHFAKIMKSAGRKSTVTRAGRLFMLLGLALLASAVGQQTDLHTLPSFSLVLSVDKSENALIVFQDRLISAVKLHLQDFFKQKIESATFESGEVTEVALTGAYVWRELALGDSKTGDASAAPNKYEVRSSFDLQLELSYEATNSGEPPLSPSILDLFLIEAFQGDNYWNLVHTFLSDDILEDITEVKITVLATGFVRNNGQDPSAFDDYEYSASSGGWSGAMTVGIVFAAFFCVTLILMWVYLCCCAKGTFLFKYRFRVFNKQRNAEKAESVTDDQYSTSSVASIQDEHEQWMNVWTKSLTSIPLRDPSMGRPSKKRSKGVRHPAQHHNSYLNAIVEAEDECSTVVSVEVDSHRRNVRQDPPTAAELEAQSEYNKGNSTDIVEYQPQGTEISRTHFHFEGGEARFEYTTSQPQMDNINEIC